ncbi:MAG TPA: hypothetical protein VFT05_16810 [Burkholderiaceae bacterium]|nr:hypothetical protein [Burkholderiaceae bacterium]
MHDDPGQPDLSRLLPAATAGAAQLRAAAHFDPAHAHVLPADWRAGRAIDPQHHASPPQPERKAA